MLKKTVTIAAVAALVTAGVFIAAGQAGQGKACEGKSKTASACTKSASAAKVSAAKAGGSSCSRTKTAGNPACAGMSASAKSACCAKMSQQAHYAQVRKVADNIPERVNSRVVLTGTYKCGSCDLGATDKCQAFLKTASGQLYPIAKNPSLSDMQKLHMKGKNDFEVTARVTKQGGAKYLEVTHFDSI
ncbi:MAG: hypothetical protein PVF33_04985 [Candidatus Latescibacterota bacterium]